MPGDGWAVTDWDQLREVGKESAMKVPPALKRQR